MKFFPKLLIRLRSKIIICDLPGDWAGDRGSLAALFYQNRRHNLGTFGRGNKGKPCVRSSIRPNFGRSGFAGNINSTMFLGEIKKCVGGTPLRACRLHPFLYQTQIIRGDIDSSAAWSTFQVKSGFAYFTPRCDSENIIINFYRGSRNVALTYRHMISVSQKP